MYRLVLYELVALLLVAFVYGFLGILIINPFSLLFSVLFLLIICWNVNFLFAKIYSVQTNLESVYITALILALILKPANSVSDYIFLGWTAVWSMASKYLFVVGKKHIFNPAAVAVLLLAFTINQSANWWIGTRFMLPFVMVGGFLIVRKIRRFSLVLSSIVTAIVTVLFFNLLRGTNLFVAFGKTILDSPLIFFTSIMLTEPLTTPPKRVQQFFYGVITGFLFAPQLHLRSIYTTPEIALCLGNIYTYLISPKFKLILKLKKRIKLAPGIYEYVFDANQKVGFNPGQYMEWTLSHNMPDSRGNRRYFTIASSPTEKDIRIGIKFYPESSSFKNALKELTKKDEIIASQLSGDFTLPKDPHKSCVFIAGGIGITPFRSMIKYLLDTCQKRSIIILYANKTASEIIYKEVFDEAERKLGIKTIYGLTEIKKVPKNWTGIVGRFDAGFIKQQIPNFKSQTFYLSGPRSMITAFQNTLKKMNVPSEQIIIDYFPGFV